MRNKTIILFSVFLLQFFSLKIAAIKSTDKDDSHISVVVIDPGHGGKDAGASVGNVHEKDIVLDLSLRLGQMIKNKYPETKVIYTRSTDVFIPLHERARIANKNKADLFISIHVNGAESKSPFGTETFVLGEDRQNDNFELVKKENAVILLEDDYTTRYEGFDPNSPESNIMFLAVQSEYLEQSIMLASAIQDQFRKNAKRYDRSVKQAGFLVLRQVTMPGVLVEVGFVTHPEERKYLSSEDGKKELSESIFNAFEIYKHKTESQSSFAVRADSNTQESEKKEELMLPDTKNDSPAEIKTETLQTESSNLYFSIQIGASKKKLEPVSANFKGLKNVFRIENNGFYKYFSGKFTTEAEAEKSRKNLLQKFPDAFVVAFDNEKLVSLKKKP